MQSQQLRREFLQYFKGRHHVVIPSSAVIPHDDPTLMFTNAGMNQFKDLFLGKSARDYSRATSSQKCIRAGGKHNDLENVGHTSRHLTFFEMLGNFSFGDYFKKEAIQFAWEVATQVFGLDPQRIWPTIFLDDEESFQLWMRYVPANRISRFGEKDNFWSMGDVGPCGPCSELLYDRGPRYGTAKNPLEDSSGERYLEFWNLVFMQYNRLADGSLERLPKPSIDTGVGLERVVSLKMGVDSLFETDILFSLIQQISEIAGLEYNPHDKEKSPAFRVIADHLRSLSFAIADGAQPSNVERGYVLRKILRRAVRYGRQLGLDAPFLAKVLPALILHMGEDYPELISNQNRIVEILTTEEEAFFRTLKRGGNILSQIIEHSHHEGNKISGDDVFKLKDTYGLPVDEIALIAIDNDLTLDLERYKQLEVEAKERSKSSHKTVRQHVSENLFSDFLKSHGPTKFLGYTQYSAVGKVLALIVDGAFVQRMSVGQNGMVILDETPFYAEMGGQIGDQGTLKGEHQLFSVMQCHSPFKGIIAHIGKLEEGNLEIGQPVIASINKERRQQIANNHTATHLLHWALQKTLGEHIRQAGSVVESERLRFDFSHHKALTREEIRTIEDLVNNKIRENRPVNWYEISYEEAQQKREIKQFFGDKYDRRVRVVDIDYSKELCGGTHVEMLGCIGLFRITNESSISAGMRRIEAVTGHAAENFVRESEDLLDEIALKLKSNPKKLQEKIKKLLEEHKQLEETLNSLKKAQINEQVAQLMKQVATQGNIPLLVAELPVKIEDLRLYMDQLMGKISSGIVVLAAGKEDKCQVLVRVTDDWVSKGKSALQIINEIAPLIEGSGGGKAQFAQAGGKAPQNISKALSKIKALFQ